MIERFLRHAGWLVPLLFGLLSVALGQDDGWDMRNYHLYNAHALLNGRMDVDLSPAGFQTYFNPALDLPYFLLTAWLPPMLVAFIMGTLHGLNFVLLLAIARQLLPREASRNLPVWLALSGVLGAGFLSELGNSMGDDLTALLVLAPLWLLLRQWDRPALRVVLLAGLLMGAGTGLKLTNATFALAMCLAMLAMPGAFWLRLRAAFVFGLGVLAGISATAGYWMLEMWRRFGNPLFPQFNTVFHSPMAGAHGVLDTDHVPHSFGEALLWPFVFTRDIARVAEVPIRQLIWPLLYVLVIALALDWLLRRGRVRGQTMGARAGFTLLFVCIAYLIWMKLFGIYRYLIPVELLAPLLVWLIVARLLPPLAARRSAMAMLLVSGLYVMPFVTWGHAGWAERSFSAEVPPFAQPSQSIVFLVEHDPPTGWLAQFMPAPVAVVGAGTGFPESAAYRRRIQDMIAARSGPHYVLFPAAVNVKERGAMKKLAIAQALGLTDSPAACARLEKWLQKVRFQVQVRPVEGGARCTLELEPKHRIDLEALDRAAEQRFAVHLADYQLVLDASSCRRYNAAVGSTPYPYRLCEVRPR